MAFVIKDRVKETTTTTGTGTVTLAGAVSGFEAFSAIGNTNTTYYAIVHQSANEWEIGIGTYTASGTTLSRDTVLSSSNSDSAVTFTSGTKDVFCTYPAEKAVYTSASPSFVDTTLTGNFVGTSATFSDHVSVSSFTVTGNTTIGGSLVGASATFDDHVSVSSFAVTGITSIGGSLVGTSATFGDHVSVSSFTATGIVSVGGSLVGTSATFGDHVSVSSFAATGIVSVGGSLVGTSATFSNHVPADTLAVTGITSIGGSLVGTSATFGDHVSVSSMTVTGNVTASQYFGGGGNLTGVQATSAALATNVSGGYAVLTSAQISNNVSIGGGLYVNTSLGVGVASPLGQVHISKNAIADIVSLTDAASVSISFANGQNFHLTLAGNRTLANPDTCVPGQVGSIFIVQDGTGSRTLSYAANWEFPAATAPTLSTSAAACDRLDYIVRTSTAVQAIVSKEYS